jgi:phage replication-related protein YjqB (UPF0714/DUF867 family)
MDIVEETKLKVLSLADEAGILVWRKSEFADNHFVAVEDGMDGDLANLMQFYVLAVGRERERAAMICHHYQDVQYPAAEIAERILRG